MDSVQFKSLEIINFGCFEKKEVIFSGGLNMLVGPNESGKTTIIEALTTAIFEDGRSRKKAVEDRHNWRQQSGMRLSLRFNTGDVEYTLVRNYENGQDWLIDSNGIKYEGQPLRDRLTEIFGTSDRRLFEAIAVISSDFPESLEQQKSKLKSKLELPVLGGFDRTRVDQYLQDKVKELDNPRGHNPREIDLLMQQISERNDQLEGLQDQLNSLAKDKAEFEEVKSKLAAMERDIDRLEIEIAGTSSYKELNERLTSLEERLANHLSALSRAEQTGDNIDRIETELSRIDVPDGDTMRKLGEKREVLSAAVEKYKQKMDALIARRGRASLDFLSVTLLLAIFCLMIVFQGNGTISIGPFERYIPYLLGAVSLLWLFRLSVYVIFFKKKKQISQLFRDSVKVQDDFYGEINDRYKLQSADPLKTLSEKILKRERLEYHLEYLMGNFKALTEGEGIEYLNQAKINMEIDIARINAEMDPIAKFATRVNDLSLTKEKLTATRVRCNAYRERAASLAERCSIIDSLNGEMSRINGEIKGLRRRQREILELVEIYKITRVALNRAADLLIENSFEIYNSEASRYLELLTAGRYDHIIFNPDQDNFEISGVGSEGRLPVGSYLSSSTRDAVYMALRLAAIGKIADNFAVPAIFDQADIRMDEKRRSAFMDMVRNLAVRIQVLLIGLERAGQPDGANVIELLERPLKQMSPSTI